MRPTQLFFPICRHFFHLHRKQAIISFFFSSEADVSGFMCCKYQEKACPQSWPSQLELPVKIGEDPLHMAGTTLHMDMVE
jgi:hypothetical protein